MQRIFEDERRRNGGVAPSPYRVRPERLQTLSGMLESGRHFLALPSASANVLVSNQSDAVVVNRA